MNFKQDPQIEAAKEYAFACHKAVNQTYDYKPYSFHLEMVVDYAIKYIWLMEPNMALDVICACYCHDLIEDARCTYNDVKAATNETVAELVYAVTNEKGKNRKERASAKYYADMIACGDEAVFVKLCDRLANISYSVSIKSDMVNAYKKEMNEFTNRLCTPRFKPMFSEMIDLLSTT